jgi:predicted nucleic acid-binding protein
MPDRVFLDTNILLYAKIDDGNSDVLYTEDLQNGQIINNQLRIINPL